MTVRITGELASAEVEAALYATHFCTRDTRNHRYSRDQLADRDRAYMPECTRHQYDIPQRWAWRDELSRELGDDRDKSRDCPSCLRRP
jgi:hypothetical protein